MKCARCKTVFSRYDYGTGRKRMRRWGRGGRTGSVYGERPKASITNTCIICKGSVKQI